MKQIKSNVLEGTSKDFEKKQDESLLEMESKRRDILLEEYCKKLFHLMDCFWEAIAFKWY